MSLLVDTQELTSTTQIVSPSTTSLADISIATSATANGITANFAVTSDTALAKETASHDLIGSFSDSSAVQTVVLQTASTSTTSSSQASSASVKSSNGASASRGNYKSGMLIALMVSVSLIAAA